jgi:hypothetical protein
LSFDISTDTHAVGTYPFNDLIMLTSNNASHYANNRKDIFDVNNNGNTTE